jgi:hypothetical protein
VPISPIDRPELEKQLRSISNPSQGKHLRKKSSVKPAAKAVVRPLVMPNSTTNQFGKKNKSMFVALFKGQEECDIQEEEFEQTFNEPLNT